MQNTCFDCRFDDFQHTSAAKRNLSLKLACKLQNLLNSVHVGGKGGDDDSAVGVFHKQLAQRGGDNHLAHRVTRPFHVGGLGKQKQNSLVAYFRKAVEIHRLAAYRSVVYFEVARMEDCADGRSQRDCHAARHRVAHVDEFRRKIFGAHCLPVADFAQITLYSALRQLVGQKPQRQLRAVNGSVDLTQKIRHRAYMVLVPVCEKHGFDLLSVFFEIGYIGNHRVYARHFVGGKRQSRVDNDDFVGVFKSRQIFAYFTHAAEKNYLYLFVFVRLFLPCAARFVRRVSQRISRLRRASDGKTLVRLALCAPVETGCAFVGLCLLSVRRPFALRAVFGGLAGVFIVAADREIFPLRLVFRQYVCHIYIITQMSHKHKQIFFLFGILCLLFSSRLCIILAVRRGRKKTLPFRFCK